MSLRTPARPVIAALALALPLGLAACGSGDEENSAASSTVKTTSAKASTSAAPTSSEKPSEDKPEEQEEKKEEDKKEETKEPEQPQQAPQTLVNPFEGQPQAPAEGFAPIEGGQDDPAVKEAITGLVNGLYAQQTIGDFGRYMLDSTCQRVLAQQPPVPMTELDQFNNVPITQMTPEWGKFGLESVSDVSANGDEASATVTTRNPNGIESATMIFANEGGRWKMCSPVQP